jgi:hypothetical protein
MWQNYGRNERVRKHLSGRWPRNTGYRSSLRTSFAKSVWRVRHEKTTRNLQAREYLLDHIRVARTSVFRILTFFRKPRCRIPALQKENGAWFGACSGEALRNSDRRRTAGFYISQIENLATQKRYKLSQRVLTPIAEFAGLLMLMLSHLTASKNSE